MEEGGTGFSGVEEGDHGNFRVGEWGNVQGEVAVDAATADRRYWHGVDI